MSKLKSKIFSLFGPIFLNFRSKSTKIAVIGSPAVGRVVSATPGAKPTPEKALCAETLIMMSNKPDENGGKSDEKMTENCQIKQKIMVFPCWKLL